MSETDTEADRLVRAIFECKWCGAEHAYPEAEGWARIEITRFDEWIDYNLPR